jgi:hypothetical protein
MLQKVLKAEAATDQKGGRRSPVVALEHLPQQLRAHVGRHG